MSKKKPHRSRPHTFTDMVHQEVATQTPISPQREESAETGRQRVLEVRGREGCTTKRELHCIEFQDERETK